MRSAVIFLLASALAGASSAADEDGLALLLQQQRYPEAVKMMERQAREHPGSAEVLLALGRAYESVHRTGEARRCYDLLVRLDPNNAMYLRLSAQAEADARHDARALKLARRALKLAPGSKEVALTYARILLREDRADESGKIFQKLLHRFPGDRAVEFAMADYFSSVGRLEEALAYFDRLVRDDPANSAYRRERASVLYRMGQFKKAVAEWEALAGQKRPDEKSLMDLGWAAWHDRRLDDAENVGMTLVKADPENPAYLRFLAHIKIEKDDAASALTLGQRALERFPSDKDTMLVVSKALFHLRRDDEAMRLLHEAASRYADDRKVVYQMADFLSALDRQDEALVLFNELVEKNPNDPMYRKRRARAAYAQGNFDQAVADWKQLHEKYPGDTEPLNNLLADAYNRGAYDEAIEWIRELAGTRSLDALTWLTLSRIYRKLGHLPQALDAAEKSYEIDPTFLSGLFDQAEILEQMQDWPKAREAWSQILSANPNSIRAMFALARVEEGEKHLDRAVEIVRAVKRQFFSEKDCPAYIELYEARLLADDEKLHEAMKIVKRVERKHPSVPALLYHGLSASQRGDSLWVEDFRRQMVALKKAGFHSINVSQLERFFDGQGTLPENPILITFDDGRADSFKFADPVLRETGFRATMFVIVDALGRHPFHASPEDVRRYQATGRWEIQLHADRSHVFVPVDEAGHQGHFLTNRMWLADRKRLETEEEAEKRIEGDYTSGVEKMKALLPGQDVIAFAFPYGDFGQSDYTNDPDIAAFNERMARERFKLTFLEDQYGYTYEGAKTDQIGRLEVLRGTTDKQLTRSLQLGRPVVQAKMLEAQIWVRAGQPRRAGSIYTDLKRDGVDQPELYAEWGSALGRMDETFGARQMYGRALVEDPGSARDQMLLDQARQAAQPSVSFGGDGWNDSNARGFARGLGRARASTGPLDLEAYLGHGRYTESGFMPVTSNEGGGASTLHVASRLDLHGQYTRRRFDLGPSPDRNDFAAGAGMRLWKGLRVDGTFGEDDVGTASAIGLGRRYRFQQGTLDFDPSLDWTLGLSYANFDYNDQNREWDGRLNLTRKLGSEFSLGYALWIGDSRFEAVQYWTPQRLRQHMAVAGYDHSFGARIDATGVPQGKLSLRYGAGVGYQLSGTRFVQNAGVGAEWRLTEMFFVSGNYDYLTTPFYNLSQFTAGIGLTY